MINIEGLDKLELLRELYDKSIYQVFNSKMFGTILAKQETSITVADVQQSLACSLLKVDLSSDIEFDETAYDMINGTGAAEKVVNKVRSDTMYRKQDTTIAEKLFHKSRIMFAIINGKIMCLDNSELSHWEWLSSSLNINDQVFENIIRGYYKDGKAYFYTGGDMRAVECLPIKIVVDVTDKLFKLTGISKINVYNGVKVGIPGEPWEPLNYINDFYNVNLKG